ncbi:cytochrome c oxidase subunit 7C, mitochondrial-like [Belonocnema kinseyi]|uniref:cytochrome c oxidase subunit 7C, mitochondrial-like n=1 Tax=Belonocnema kinseyi TaxID=2817044 RepID=UPI00143D725D|nr:cytochrome c oxidase subunit 7C, mitochondrial-like [Belonocnema kinseyi]
MFGQISRQAVRNFTTTAIRRSHAPGDGVPGENLPFSIKNRYAVTLKFMIFFGSGFAIPFAVLRFQMLK